MVQQIKMAVLGIALCLATVANANASVVTFTGTWSSYQVFGGAADPLNLVGETFAIRADIDGAGNVLSGYIRVTSGPGSQYNINFTGPNGGSSTSPFNITGTPTASGGLLTFGTTQSIPNFSFASLNSLGGSAGNATLGGNFGGNLGFYSASITAVPEPSSVVMLGLLVSGCGAWQYRRSRRKSIA